MKGIVFAAAAIAIGVTAGLAAPYLAGKVKTEITQTEPIAQRSEAQQPTSDPGGLVGAAEVQPRQKRAQPVAVPAPAKAAPVPQPKHEAETPRVPTRIVREAAVRKLDCRKYVPKAQVTISVPCDGKKSDESSEDDDKKETRKSRKEKKSGTASDDDTTVKPGICRQYVTRAGLTQLQTVPCNAPRTAQVNR